jgi:hypothetical protein
MAKQKRNKEMTKFNKLFYLYGLGEKKSVISSLCFLLNNGFERDLNAWERELDVSPDCVRELYEQWQRVLLERTEVRFQHG